ncbi:urea ABC transporter permease subunit UrtB, partial [Myxococcota bacterium]|nr:urea ABC transporter permease subunit UrtB [Myxococcota bacterium]
AAYFDAASGLPMEAADAVGLKKIIVNNRMRTDLRTTLARLRLASPDAVVRKVAAKSMMADRTPRTLELLREAFAKERDAGVRETLRVALALSELESEDPELQLGAIGELAGSLHGEVRNALAALLERSAGDSAEQGEDVRAVRSAAEAAIAAIDRKRSGLALVETLFFGLSLGFVLVLAAIGLAITFGVMGVINMAHGELIMLGAYTTWGVQQLMPESIDSSIFVAIPCAFLVSGLVGVVIERGVVQFLYGRPLETLLATFGISLILQQAVRTLFSPLNRAVETPGWMSGQWVVNDALSLTYNRLFIVAFSIAVFGALVGLLQVTGLGLQIRAVAQNRDMARAMGVRGSRIDAVTFGLGSGVAGLAGVALSQLTNVGPNLGQAHIVDSFMVVVFGGVGNLWGTLVAGLGLGIANKFLEPFAGAVLAKIVVLVFIILFIQRRPRGLFPQKGRSAGVT